MRLLLLPCGRSAEQRPQFRTRRGGIVERVQECVVALGIEYEQTLVEQHVNRLPPRGLDHELGARLAEDRCCLIDKLSGIGLDAQVNAALRIRIR